MAMYKVITVMVTKNVYYVDSDSAINAVNAVKGGEVEWDDTQQVGFEENVISVEATSDSLSELQGQFGRVLVAKQ